jgi:hypothetical protein
MKTFFLAAFATFLLTACASNPFKDNDAGVRIVVTYGVAKFVEKAGTPAAQATRAQKVRAVATDIKAFMGGDTVTLPLLEEAIRERLPDSLSLADRVLVNELITLIMGELRARIDDGLLKPEQKVIVVKVIDWVLVATA